MSPSGVSAGYEATPKLAVIVAVDAGDAHELDLVAQLLRQDDGALERRVREQDQELLAAVAAGEIALAERRPERGTRRGQRLVALLVPEDVVDLLEVVEVAEDRARGGDSNAPPAPPCGRGSRGGCARWAGP